MILIWDIETSTFDLRIRTYDLKVKISRYDPRDIVRDWSILSASWKELGKKPKTIAIDPKDVFNDKKIVVELHKFLSAATMLIGHNSDAFDLKKFNTRAIFHGLKPIPPIASVDTLKIARKHFAFTSKKLAYIAEFLKVGAKDESPDWNKVLDGNRAEIARMKKYNQTDVEVTEKVYLKLRSWATNHPKIHTVTDIAGHELPTCQCGSANVIKRGFTVTRTGKKQRMQCNDCGAWK